jgi:hypothetical protein
MREERLPGNHKNSASFLIKSVRSLHCNNQSGALSGEIREFPKHFAKKPAGREPAVCHPVFFFS